MTGRTATDSAVGMEPQSGGMHNENSAVEAIGRLEELARAATPGNWRAWTTRRRSPEIYTDAPADREPNDLVGSTLRKADAAYIAAANPQAILSLIEERRALREALGDMILLAEVASAMLADRELFKSTERRISKARAALDRRAGT